MPLHTSWFKSTDTNDEINKFKANVTKILPSAISPNFAKLFDNVKDNPLISDPLNAISLFGPHLKEIVVDLAERIVDADKYSKLFEDSNFVNKFVA